MKHYKNWPSIGLRHALGKKPESIILRDNSLVIPGNSKVPLEHLAILLESGWKVSHIDSEYLILVNPDGYKIQTRLNEMSDILALVEVFGKEVYGHDFAGKTVVDVGMYIGDSSIYFVARGAKRVVGIEAFKDNYDLATKNISINGLEDRILPINAAISDKEGEALLDISDLLHSSHLVTDARNAGTVPVKTMTINQIIKEYKLDIIDLVKIDCEGCEYDLIESLDKDSLSKIKEFVIEYHNGVDSIKKSLEKHDFSVKVVKDSLQGILYAFRK